MVKVKWEVSEVDKQHWIVYIKDLNGPRSVTNDAESVFESVQNIYGRRFRVVYEDSQGETWEIKHVRDHWGKHIGFEKWHGLIWDKLKGHSLN